MNGSLLETKPAASQLWKFADFQPGVVIGQKEMSLTPAFFEQWLTLYPRSSDRNLVPMGAVALVLMQAYTSIVANRPPGNVHVGQRCTLHRVPDANTRMEATVKCIDKRHSGERRIVELAVDIKDVSQNGRLMSGLLTLFWAQ